MRRTRNKEIDLAVEVQKLYRRALAKDDFAGAASILRLLKDIERNKPPRTSSEDESDRFMKACTPEDFAEMDAILAAMDDLKRRVLSRESSTGTLARSLNESASDFTPATHSPGSSGG